MDGIEGVIAAAVADAKAGGMEGDSGEYTEDAGVDAGADGGAEEVGDAAGGAAAAEGAAEGTEAAAETEPSAEPVAEADKKTKDEEAFAAEHGIKAKEPSGRENRIPYSRVKTITDNAVKKARTAWEAETKSSQELIQNYEQRVNGIAEIERIIFEEPERYIEMLPKFNPRYAELIGKQSAATPQSAPTAAATTADGRVDFSKAPTGDGPDGNYTPQGLSNLLQWTIEQATAVAEQRISQRYEPLEKSYKRAQDVRTRMESDHKAAGQLLQDYSTREGFKENYQAIEAELKQQPAGLSAAEAMKRAYEKVVFGSYKAKLDKATTDYEKVRKQIMDDMAAAPQSTAVGVGAPRSGAARTALPDNASMEDVIKHAIDTSGIRNRRV